MGTLHIDSTYEENAIGAIIAGWHVTFKDSTKATVGDLRSLEEQIPGIKDIEGFAMQTAMLDFDTPKDVPLLEYIEGFYFGKFVHVNYAEDSPVLTSLKEMQRVLKGMPKFLKNLDPILHKLFPEHIRSPTPGIYVCSNSLGSASLYRNKGDTNWMRAISCDETNGLVDLAKEQHILRESLTNNGEPMMWWLCIQEYG